MTGQLSAIPQHMKALYTALSHLTLTITDFGTKTVNKDYFDEKMTELHDKADTNAKEITVLKEGTKSMESKIDNNHHRMLSGMNTEIDMRIQKLNNVVIFDSKESRKQEAKAKKEEDIAIFNELLNDISPTEVLPTKTMFRAGKPSDGKTRPFIVALNNKDTKEKLFKNTKSLRNK